MMSRDVHSLQPVNHWTLQTNLGLAEVTLQVDDGEKVRNAPPSKMPELLE